MTLFKTKNKHSYYKLIDEQFRLRSKGYENSARWIKDKGLLLLYKELFKPKNSSPISILDLCCGTGIVGEQFLSENSSIFGLDISWPMLKLARRRLDFCIHGQAERLPFQDETFDLVVCRQASHFLDMEKLACEVFRVCKSKHGKAIIGQIVPFGRLDKHWLYKIHACKQPLLRNFLTEEDMVGVLKKASFVSLRRRYYYIEESINEWLRFAPELSFKKVAQIRNLFYQAPRYYKKIHNVRFEGDDIKDTMKWVVIAVRKGS